MVEKVREFVRETPVITAEMGLGSNFPTSQSTSQALPKAEIDLIAAPSKAELARTWLTEHPEDRELSGRDLEVKVLPMGVTIGYKTWNLIKKEF